MGDESRRLSAAALRNYVQLLFILRQISIDFTGRFLGGYFWVEKIFSVKVELKFIGTEFQVFFDI